ncbi:MULTISPECIES: TlpA disulfide reductase family protein [unclassified Lysobacter]|uniref:TlpA family protein disulfide reductase n=1 Tax=unclassified Lysobacter TaxID=2635362 RepID=UPI0006F770E9|nr:MULTISPECIES: TlpA disulfide reductase family protein [unclassified Lysobacter]KQZ66724.1 thioredoxin [Lysobacter sp. Root559]KRC32875.1 thioredoxin [Lysobacter sp. Root76]KRD68046.1 thioredoxin [Lysobacter sp. Root96]
MTLRRLAPILALSLLTVALAGCNKPAPTPEPKVEAPAPKPPVEAPAPAPAEPAAAEAAAAKPGAVPELKLPTLDNGEFDLAAHRGKWVVVNFWATWCAPCLKEMPELSAMDAMREHIEVIGLAYEEIDAADMRAFLKKRPVVYPIAIVDTYDPPKAFDTPRGLPTTYLVGPDGKIVDKFMGPVTATMIEGAIAKAGGPAAPAEAKPSRS